MLDQIKEKNAQIFIDHFNEVFGNKFNVECEWGFPVMTLEFSTKEELTTVRWKLNIDVTKPDYSLQTFASKLEGEKEIPHVAMIDKTALDFIISRSMILSQNLFSQETTKNKEKPKEVEEEITETEEKLTFEDIAN